MLKTDHDFREALRRHVAALHGDDACALIKSEMSLVNGNARIDVAVIGERLTGYEYKGLSEDINETYGQVSAFSGVFDRVVFVGPWEVIDRVKSIVPSWWGLEVALCEHGADITFDRIREPVDNPGYDEFAIAQLLRREEALILLRKMDVDVGSGRQRAAVLYGRLCDELKLEELRARVREALKAREGWVDSGLPGGGNRQSIRSISRTPAFV